MPRSWLGVVSLASPAACSSSTSSVLARRRPRRRRAPPRPRLSSAASLGRASCPIRSSCRPTGIPSRTTSSTTSWPSPERDGRHQHQEYTAELIAHGGVDTGVKIEIRSGGPATGNQLELGRCSTRTRASCSASSRPTRPSRTPSRQPTVAICRPPGGPDDPHVEPDRPSRRSRPSPISARTTPRFSTSRGAVHRLPDRRRHPFTRPGRRVLQRDAGPVRGVGGHGRPAGLRHRRALRVPVRDHPVAEAPHLPAVSAYGYDPYPSIVTRPANITKYAACFKKLVPIIQQGIVDYAANPGAANELIVKLVTSTTTAGCTAPARPPTPARPWWPTGSSATPLTATSGPSTSAGSRA